ncbi:MAG: LuxR C-terminal-related transcriptional regulator [Actinomycetota bacterium]|nr:LuxR C-terminal-related transcriptional regulator [Actinomycetota bacterium]
MTGREVEVLQLLAAGHTNAEIGKELFMSVRTAETHRAQIQRKTGCSSRAQLTSYARGHGLTEN